MQTLPSTGTPVVDIFDGVEMVLVPAGCFAMGTTGQGGHWCFDRPFWIDKYEVTNEQFDRLGGFAGRASANKNLNHPRDRINWIEANDYCKKKPGGRLPTEAEWEYAAIGSNPWSYPWGNDLNAIPSSEVIFANTSTAGVGNSENRLREQNQSWVGAVDMAGNVTEWTHTIARPYPYDPLDGREDGDNTNLESRIIRGGSWRDNPQPLKSFRSLLLPGYSDGNMLGFRCYMAYEDEEAKLFPAP